MAKDGLVIRILFPAMYIGKIEISVNANKINVVDIDNEIIEISGKM